MTPEFLDLQRKYDTARAELNNFHEIFAHVIPTSGEIPRLPGIDIYGQSIPLNGLSGGDHIVFVDFNHRYDLTARIDRARREGQDAVADRLERNRQRAGILLADVSGHQLTDALMAAMLHQAFLLGVEYELRDHGEVTTELFEHLNTRFYQSSSQFKFITMIYGEITTAGAFRFLSAAHPQPIVFSREWGRLVPIGNDRTTHFPPIGTMPSKKNWEARGGRNPHHFKEDYSISELNLMGWGDILLLFSDGLSEHATAADEFYFPERLTEVLRRNRSLGAREIFERIVEDLRQFAPLRDDLSLIVIKKT
ncbi:MAG TPA: PP2C family protein-serine/threonine phosphatase [Candidatus Aminicenantes bacterium]|nr:PP2C family protein-serine/threonine phosphatase [Candidatus Aminicenantes bacterium]